jgi:hypothetical protein
MKGAKRKKQTKNIERKNKKLRMIEGKKIGNE